MLKERSAKLFLIVEPNEISATLLMDVLMLERETFSPTPFVLEIDVRLCSWAPIRAKLGTSILLGPRSY